MLKMHKNKKSIEYYASQMYNYAKCRVVVGGTQELPSHIEVFLARSRSMKTQRY